MVEWISEANKRLKELYEYYQKEAVEKLASDLGVTADYLISLVEKKRGITPSLSKKLRYLWAIKIGKVKVPVPPPPEPPVVPPKPIEAPEVERKCIQFGYEDALVNEETSNEYLSIDHIDTLPEYVEKSEYDYAMKEIRKEVNLFFSEWITFKGKLFVLEEIDDVEPNVLYNDECGDYRTYEFVVVDLEEDKYHTIFTPSEVIKYAFKYGQGRIIKSVGNIPVLDDFVATLKRIGKWEK